MLNGKKENLIRYWRTCIADTVLGQGRATHRDLKARVALSKEELECGRIIERSKLESLFHKMSEEIECVQVCLWPMCTARQTAHGIAPHDGLPQYVAPIVSMAGVKRDGTIWPAQTVIARDILEPLRGGAFSIGTVEKLDAFLTKSGFFSSEENEPHERVWQRYREYYKRLLKDVANGWPSKDCEYNNMCRGMLEVTRDGAVMVRAILAVYDNILKTRPDIPLLETYAVTEIKEPSPSLKAPHAFAERIGHSTDAFPLADKQRDILAHLAMAKDGEVLTVNGPPGTGKTTLVLSAIAGEWVRAAIAGDAPPLIAATSNNNQAVTNIIDAFAKDFAPGDGPFAGRWLPDIKSFGLYLPAKSLELTASKKYQTEKFFERLETEQYLCRAEKAYLDAAGQALPELEPLTVQTVVDELRHRIRIEAGKLEAVDAARDQVAYVLGNAPEETLAWFRKCRAQYTKNNGKNENLLKGWQLYLDQESIFLRLFSFLPPVAKKRRLRAQMFLKKAGGTEDDLNIGAIGKITRALRRRVDEGRERLQTTDDKVTCGQDAMDRLARARAVLARAAGDNGATGPDDTRLERGVDCGIRFQMFLLATHYWEGRWLLETSRRLPEIREGKNKTGAKTVKPRWYRRMMLTPCMVSTFFTLPRKMSVRKYQQGEFHDDYLFNFLDLLIVDEAGQVLPEVAGAAFALAKKALVIGDTHQLEPIAGITKSVDVGNLVENKLLSKDHKEKNLGCLEKTGVVSTSGSAMQVSQSACRYHGESDLDRGLYLFEHRRCHDEIIQYSNVLCYKGKLEPCRGPWQSGRMASWHEPAPLPGPLTYLHVDGKCTPSRGSRKNASEAQAIADWLKSNRKTLEDIYDEELEKIVGVVTPFAPQVSEIGTKCRERDIKVGPDGMTVGTIHALQGADRDVVIFSQVYSRHEGGNGKFIDHSPSMLNVAVSRAKDAFLVCGDMHLFETATRGTPRHLLGQLLFARPENALEGSQTPRRNDLVEPQREVQTLYNARAHDEFLRGLLAGDAQKIVIVSPWIKIKNMKEAKILPALEEAGMRGMAIMVYADAEWTSNDNDFKDARKELERIGVDLKTVPRVHSKAVIADKTLIAYGSFNWLSASRNAKWARHEATFVYRGSRVADEIDMFISSLDERM